LTIFCPFLFPLFIYFPQMTSAEIPPPGGGVFPLDSYALI
jgi:hypothetical protein